LAAFKFFKAYFAIGMRKAISFFLIIIVIIHDENKMLTIFYYWSPASSNASAECNLRLSCAYFMAEVAMSIQKVLSLSFLE
jgi:hypothetical protein